MYVFEIRQLQLAILLAVGDTEVCVCVCVCVTSCCVSNVSTPAEEPNAHDMAKRPTGIKPPLYRGTEAPGERNRTAGRAVPRLSRLEVCEKLGGLTQNSCFGDI